MLLNKLKRTLIRLFSKGDLAFYWRYIIQPHKWLVLSTFSLMFVFASLDMASVGLGVPLLDTAMKTSGESQNVIINGTKILLKWFGITTDYNSVLLALLFVVGVVTILRGIALLVQRYCTTIIAQKLRIECKSKLFATVLNSQYEYLSRKSRGAALYDINSPSAAIYEVITVFGNLLSAFLNCIVLVGFMMYLSLWATLGAGLISVFWVQGWRRFIDPRSARSGREIYELNRLMGKLDIDAIDGVKVVKAHRLEPKMIQLETEFLKAELKPKLKLVILKEGITCLNEFVGAFIVVSLGLITLGFGWFSLPFSELVVLFVTIRKISPLLSIINGTYAQVNSQKKNVEVLADILNETPLENTGQLSIESVKGIQLVDVSFYYSSKPKCLILDKVNCTMRRGEVTAIVGSTGSGKSTLANMLMRLYQPISGNLYVNDNVDLQSIDLTQWRQKVGYVSQDIFLFNDTIKQNIALWNDAVSQSDIELATQLAQLHDFIVTLPDGYNTTVGDRGLKLSGGQAQRVAIARAIIRKPEILIFDEATSALDNLTEKAVYESIHNLRKEAIVVVVAHRLSTIREADQIIVLNEGNIVEQGTHNILMTMNGVYTQLYQGAHYKEESAIVQ